MHSTKAKKPVLKGCIQYESNYVTFWKRQRKGKVKRSMTARV